MTLFMKTNETMSKDYMSPEIYVHKIECEGVLCSSPDSDNEDYGGIPGNDSF